MVLQSVSAVTSAPSATYGPLPATTCSTRATCSPPPPFLPSLAHTPACLLTDHRHSRLPLSSHRSPNVLHSHTEPPTAPQLPTPTAFHRSTLPRLLSIYSLSFRTLHCWFPALLSNWSPGYVTKTKSATVVFVEPFLARIFSCSALESRSRSPLRRCVRQRTVLTTQRRHFHLSASFLRLLVARPHLSRTSSHIPLTPGHLRGHSYQHQRQSHRSPLSRLLSVGFQPSRITGLQATSPKQSPPHLTVASTPGCFRLLLWRVALTRPYVGV